MLPIQNTDQGTPAPRPARPPHHGGLVNRATITAAVLTVAIFVADFWTPLTIADGVLYVIPLLVGTLGGSTQFHLVAAGVLSALTVAGGAFSAPADPLITIVNRSIALVVIWTTAAVLSQFRHTWLALQTRTKDLDDISYALDQSAIVATTDTRGRITFANDRFCEISGYSRDELLGQDHRLLNSGYHPKDFMRTLWTAITNGRIWRGEIRNRAKDGTLYWVDTTIVPFLDDRGKPYQYMAIRYEITERKRSEDLLREQAALARLGQMAAVVAHEVKNPIAGIRGALQVIASRMATESRDRAVVGDIIARLDALNGIVQDLLVFARPRQPKHEAINLHALLANTTELLTRDPALAGLQVRVGGAEMAVPADREQLQIVFHNVLTNAGQAMGGTGSVDVDIRREGDRCLVTFADHGPGMPSEVQDKAFEAFFTTKHRGTGLGLPTARRIIEAHGGQIGIGATAGGGTTVTIRLPTVQPGVPADVASA